MPRQGQKRAAPQELRTIVARNVRKLMLETDDLKTATALGKRSGIGRRSIDRLIEGTNAATLDTLQAVAAALGVYPWQLLVEGMSARDMPVLHRPTGKEAELYQRLDVMSKAITELRQQGVPAYRPKKTR